MNTLGTILRYWLSGMLYVLVLAGLTFLAAAAIQSFGRWLHRGEDATPDDGFDPVTGWHDNAGHTDWDAAYVRAFGGEQR